MLNAGANVSSSLKGFVLLISSGERGGKLLHVLHIVADTRPMCISSKQNEQYTKQKSQSREREVIGWLA